MWALRSSRRREPPPRAKLGRPAQVVVPGGGLFALANTPVRARISACIMHACTPEAVLGGHTVLEEDEIGSEPADDTP